MQEMRNPLAYLCLLFNLSCVLAANRDLIFSFPVVEFDPLCNATSSAVSSAPIVFSNFTIDFWAKSEPSPCLSSVPRPETTQFFGYENFTHNILDCFVLVLLLFSLYFG